MNFVQNLKIKIKLVGTKLSGFFYEKTPILYKVLTCKLRSHLMPKNGNEQTEYFDELHCIEAKLLLD